MKKSIIIGAAAALAGAAGIFLFRKRKRSNTLYLDGFGYGKKLDWNKARDSAENQLIKNFESFLEILPHEKFRDKISAISVTRLFDDDVTLLLKDSSGGAVGVFIVLPPRRGRPTLEDYAKICNLISLPPDLDYLAYNADDLAELIDRYSRQGWAVSEDCADWRECIGGKYEQQNPD